MTCSNKITYYKERGKRIAIISVVKRKMMGSRHKSTNSSGSYIT